MAPDKTDYDDPELVEIDALAKLEGTRHPSATRARTRSTALIIAAVAVLLILGVGSAWIAGAI